MLFFFFYKLTMLNDSTMITKCLMQHYEIKSKASNELKIKPIVNENVPFPSTILFSQYTKLLVTMMTCMFSDVIIKKILYCVF